MLASHGEGDDADSLETDTASEFDIGVSAVPAADDDGIGTAGKDAGAWSVSEEIEVGRDWRALDQGRLEIMPHFLFGWFKQKNFF